ncbi:molybdate ABC transporter substrate-binding protein, partial [Burkholderia sp. SIMBA_045]
HKAVLSFGATGQFYAQIKQDAPFVVFLAADDETPRKAVEEGLAVPDSRFTYAVGRLVLWTKASEAPLSEDTLRKGAFEKLS